jgi:RNA polymerase sigma-70 factor, ECF subfamily
VPNDLDPNREHILLAEARKDLNAFQEVYDHYFPKVYAYVSYRVGRVQDTEDLVSNIFLKVIERLAIFEWKGEGSFGAWLFRIAHDKVVDFYRSNQTDHRVVPLEELPELVGSTLLPGDQFMQKEKLAYFRQLVGTLPSRQQEIITLKFFGGLRNLEIATILGLDERTIASHLCRGLREMHRQYLEKSFQEE